MSTKMESVADPRQLEDKPPEQQSLRNSFWDSIILFTAFSIIGLAALNALKEFLQDANLACDSDTNVTASSPARVAYINSYCYGDLPYVRYITTFNILIGTLIAAPHYLWLNLTAQRFALFFTLATKQDVVPNPKTGKWSDANNIIAERIETVYSSGQCYILVSYFAKVCFQLVITVVGLLVAIFVFSSTGSTEFYCPRIFNNSAIKYWPLDHQVECTFRTLEAWALLRWVDIVLLGIITLTLFMTFTSFLSTMEHKEVAKFHMLSALPYKFYRSGLRRSLFRSDLDFLGAKLNRGHGDQGYILWEMRVFMRKGELDTNDNARVSLLKRNAQDRSAGDELIKLEERGAGKALQLCFPTNNGFLTSIPSDPEDQFLVPMERRWSNFRTEEWEKVPTQKEFSSSRASCLAVPTDPYKYHHTDDDDDWLELEQDIRGAILSFAAFCPRRRVAVVLEYGRAAKFVPYALARAFKEVIVVNFNYEFKAYDPKTCVKVRKYPPVNIRRITFHPYTILGLDPNEYEQLTKKMEEIWEVPGQNPPPEQVPSQGQAASKIQSIPSTGFPLESDFIVVLPMQNEFEKSATTVFLDDITKKGCLSLNALLLSVYPLTVGGWWYLLRRNVEKHFFEYEPPNRQHGLSLQFQEHKCEHDSINKSRDEMRLAFPGWCTHNLSLKCGKVPCKFKFSLYERCRMQL